LRVSRISCQNAPLLSEPSIGPLAFEVNSFPTPLLPLIWPRIVRGIMSECEK
jgi:hypothetical protein